MRLFTIRLLPLILISLTVTGCGGLGHKWVENNTVYSSKFPRLEIQVNEHLQKGDDFSKIGMAGDDDIITYINNHTDQYIFWDKEGEQQLVIRIDNIKETGWFFNDFNFSADSSFLSVNEEKLGGKRFDTGIYVDVMPQQSFLTKVYGRVFGTQTRLTLYYLEKVDSSWNTKDLHLNDQQQAFLEAFDRRAQASFIIRPFSDITPPEERQQGTTNQK